MQHMIIPNNAAREAIMSVLDFCLDPPILRQDMLSFKLKVSCR